MVLYQGYLHDNLLFEEGASAQAQRNTHYDVIMFRLAQRITILRTSNRRLYFTRPCMGDPLRPSGSNFDTRIQLTHSMNFLGDNKTCEDKTLY